MDGMEGGSITLQTKTENEALLNLHFYLEDSQSHKMDAFVYNECERNLILSIREFQKFFDYEIAIEVLAKQEGGVSGKYILKKIVENPTTHAAFLVFVTSFCSYFFRDKPKTTEDVVMDKIEIIDKLKSGNYTQEEFDYIAQDDKKLRRLKNVFYKTAINENDITKIEASVNNTPISEVDYVSFEKAIDEPNEKTETIIREGVSIYIVSPILIKIPNTKAKWRGIYMNEPIEFSIRDKDFIKSVENNEIKFGSGTKIKCSIEIISRIKYNEHGEEDEKISYSVKEVYESEDEDHYNTGIKQYKKKRRKEYQDTPSLFTQNEMLGSSGSHTIDGQKNTETR